MDPYNFDWIRIGEKLIRIRLWIRLKIEENSNFVSSIKNMILKTKIFLLFISLLFIYILTKKIDFLNNIIFLYFWWFVFDTRPGSVPDPFSHLTIRIWIQIQFRPNYTDIRIQIRSNYMDPTGSESTKLWTMIIYVCWRNKLFLKVKKKDMVWTRFFGWFLCELP